MIHNAYQSVSSFAADVYYYTVLSRLSVTCLRARLLQYTYEAIRPRCLFMYGIDAICVLFRPFGLVLINWINRGSRRLYVPLYSVCCRHSSKQHRVPSCFFVVIFGISSCGCSLAEYIVEMAIDRIGDQCVWLFFSFWFLLDFHANCTFRVERAMVVSYYRLSNLHCDDWPLWVHLSAIASIGWLHSAYRTAVPLLTNKRILFSRHEN